MDATENFKKSLIQCNEISFFDHLDNRVRTRLRKQSKFELSNGDVLWGISSELLGLIINRDVSSSVEPKYLGPLHVYFAQAKFLYETGKIF